VKRLTEELPDGFARELLESAQHDAPSSGAAQRGWAAAVGAIPVKSAAGALLVGKVGLAVLAAATVVGGAAALHATLTSRSAAVRAPEPVVVAASAPEAMPAPAEAARLDAAPGAPPERRVAPKQLPGRREAHEHSAAHVQPHDPVPAAAAPAVAQSDDLRAQVELIDRARTLVEQGDGAAVRLLDSYAQQWPQGPFVIDAAILAIEAERKSGAMEQARARAQRVLADHPSAAYQARVRRALGDASIP
jgi:hypothetical protein